MAVQVHSQCVVHWQTFGISLLETAFGKLDFLTRSHFLIELPSGQKRSHIFFQKRSHTEAAALLLSPMWQMEAPASVCV